MVEIVTGVPGSGKTSYAITRLAKTFSKDEKLKKVIPNNLKIPDVKKALTNINELKTDKLNNVSALNYDEFYSQIKDLEVKYRVDKWNDEKLKELAKEYKIFGTMFIIDEFHNYFDKQDKVLVWWLSYHRHLHQHIILLTQNLSLVNAKYKAFPEIFLKAIPATLKILDINIILKKYTDARMSKTSQAGSIKIKKNKEIFALYGSGANHKSKSVILPYIILSVLVFVFIFAYFKFFAYHEDPPKKETKKENSATAVHYNHTKNVVNNKAIYDTKKSITILCTDKYCYYLSNILPYKLIFQKNNGVKILLAENIGYLIRYSLLVPENIYSLIDNVHTSLMVVTKNSKVTSVKN